MVFTRIIVFIIAFAVGLGILRYTQPIVKLFGYNDLAEKYLGSGGSYTMWKFFGIFLIILGFLYAIGEIDFFPGTVPIEEPGVIQEIK